MGIDEFYLFLAITSIISCLSVVTSVCAFPNLWSRYYIRLISYVTISDLFCVLPFTFGKQAEGSTGCVLQALFSNYFALTSVLWSFILTHQLYDVVVARNTLSQHKSILTQALCWGLPLLICLLPLSTDKIGVYASGYCGFVQKESSLFWTSKFWNMLCDCITLASLLTVTYYIYQIQVTSLQISDIFASYIMMALSKLRYYPIIIVMCWSIQIYIDIVSYYSEKLYPVWLCRISNILLLLQGTLTAIVFWFENEEVRMLWIVLIKNVALSDSSSAQECDKIRVHREQWEQSDRENSRAMSNAADTIINPIPLTLADSLLDPSECALKTRNER